MKRGFKFLKNQSNNPNRGSFLYLKKLEPESSRGPFKTKNLTKQVVTHIFKFQIKSENIEPPMLREAKGQTKEIYLRQS